MLLNMTCKYRSRLLFVMVVLCLELIVLGWFRCMHVSRIFCIWCSIWHIKISIWYTSRLEVFFLQIEKYSTQPLLPCSTIWGILYRTKKLTHTAENNWIFYHNKSNLIKVHVQNMTMLLKSKYICSNMQYYWKKVKTDWTVL